MHQKVQNKKVLPRNADNQWSEQEETQEFPRQEAVLLRQQEATQELLQKENDKIKQEIKTIKAEVIQEGQMLKQMGDIIKRTAEKNADFRQQKAKEAKKAQEDLIKQQKEEEAKKTPEQKAIENIVKIYNMCVEKTNTYEDAENKFFRALIPHMCNSLLPNTTNKELKEILDTKTSISGSKATKQLSKAFYGMYSFYNGKEIKDQDIQKINSPVTLPETLKAFVREIIRFCLIVPAAAKYVFGDDSDSLIRGYRSNRENKNDFTAAKNSTDVGSFVQKFCNEHHLSLQSHIS